MVGNLIVAAQDASQIIKITPAGVASIIAGSTPGYTNGPAASAQFNTPGDVKIDGAGNLYVADFENNAIRQITPGRPGSYPGGKRCGGKYTGICGRFGYCGHIQQSSGLIYWSGGAIYVADLFNNDIREVMPDGTVSLLAGSAAQVPSDAGRDLELQQGSTSRAISISILPARLTYRNWRATGSGKCC